MDNPGRRGRGGRARPTGRRKQLPSEQPASPIDPTQKNPIQSLVRTAITPSSNSARRVAALKELQKVLRDDDKSTASTVHGLLPVMWPQTLGLLGDSNADVRQMAAPVVGMLGAMATRQGARSGVSPGLLFDWALPLLSAQQGSADSSKAADVGSMYWVMTALREGLQLCDDKTVSRYGHALFEACQALLESDDLSVHLLAPLLALLTQAARHIHSLRAHFKDLVDLLLGWSLEPTLPDATRPLLYTAFMSFQPIWQEQQSFAAGLLKNLVSDVERLSSAQDDAITIDNLRQLLSLSSCITAIIQACGESALPCIHELLQRLARAMQSATRQYHALFDSIPSTAEEMCHFLRIIFTVAMPEHRAAQQHGHSPNSHGQTDPAPKAAIRGGQTSSVKAGQHMNSVIGHEATDSMSAHRGDPSATALDSSQPSAIQTDTETGTAAVTASCMAVLGVVLEVLKGAGSWAKSADLLAALRLSTTMLEMHGASSNTRIPESMLDLLLDSNSSFSQLRGEGDIAVVKLVTHTYLSLLQHPSHITGEAALRLVLSDLRAQLSRVTKEGAFKEGVTMARYSLSLLSQVAVQNLHAAAIWAGLHDICKPSGSMQKEPLLWVEVLRLLQSISSPDSRQKPGSVSLSQALSFWYNLATRADGPAVRLLAAEWLVASAAAVSQHQKLSSLDDSGLGEGIGAAEESLGYSVQQLQLSQADGASVCSSESQEGRMPATSFCEAAVQAVLSLAEAGDESLRRRAADYARRLLAPASAADTAPDQAAVPGAPDMIDSGVWACVTDEQLVKLGQTACERLSDVSAAVAGPWRGLLSELEPHLARIATGIGTSSSCCLPLLQHVRPSWRAELAQQPQRQLLQPQQLTRVLDWFTQASPALLIRPQAGPTILTRPAAADAAPVRKEADMMEWLAQLPGACPGLDDTQPAELRSPTSQAEAACWAVEESARQCVSARMRTHYGGPAQTFAALEAGLQTRLTRVLSNASSPHKGSATELQATWLFLEFMFALERQVQAACEGSCALPPPPLPATSFFSVGKNCKACEEWFARMRPLQLRLAAACEKHSATAFHACMHLLHLQRQASALLAPAPAEPPAPKPSPAAPQPPAAASAAEPAAPLGQADWPSLGAASAASKAKPSAQEKKRSRQASKPDRKKQAGRKAVPLAVQPRILQRSEEAAAAARPEPASRPPSASRKAGAHQKSRQTAAGADVLEKLSREVLSTLRQACGALCAMGDPDTIGGLHAHVLEAFAELFSTTRVQPAALGWMEGMRLEAGGSYQAAARIYLETLRSAGASMTAEGVAFLSSRAAAAYAAIADWDGLDAISSKTVQGASACTRTLAALDRGDSEKAAALFKTWSPGSARNGEEAGAGTAAPTPRAAHSPRSVPGQVHASAGLSDVVLLKALVALQIGYPPGAVRTEVLANAAAPAAVSDQPSSIRAGVKILGRDSRRSRGEVQISVQEGPAPMQPGQSSALAAALEEIRAEQQRLGARLALVAGEGMAATAPLLADSWLAALLCRSVEACLQGGSRQDLLRQLSSQLAQAAAGPSWQSRHLMGLGTTKMGGPDSAENSRLGTGGRAADVRPWLQAERVLRVAAGGGGGGSASEQLHSSCLLLDLAAAARRSGNEAVAARLLNRVAAQQISNQSGSENTGVLARATEAGMHQEIMLRVHMERLLLLGTDAADETHTVQAAALSQSLTAMGTERNTAGRSLRAEAYLRLASWSVTLPPAELTALRERAHPVTSDGTPHIFGGPAEPLQTAEATGDHAFRAQCLNAAAAASAAPRGSVIAGKAWEAYADWLFAQHAQRARVGSEAEGQSGLQDSLEPATAHSGGQVPAGEGVAAASDKHAVEALQAYCAALECAGLSGGQSGCSEDHIAALLRILQVQADLLGETQNHVGAIDRAIACVPVSLWHAVTPQLFSYLGHPKEAVRASVSGILIRLESISPSAVIYPALATQRRSGERGSGAEAQRVLDPLRQRSPGALDQASMFVDELARVSSLWDEQWVHTLQEVQAEVERRLGALKRETAHMQAMQDPQADISEKMAKRYADMMAPAVLMLDQTAAATISREPQTSHERAFHASFSAALTDAIAAFRCAGPPLFDAGSRPAANLLEPLHVLAGSIERRCRVSLVKLADISPRLAALSASVLPIPGQHAATHSAHLADSALPILVSVDERVEILGTKTRPKRLWFRGSNGARYSFLLKGREELRLDERLMQLLRCSNAVLRGCSVSASRQLHARTFGVIPLGPRTGLIEWVEHTVPLFGLYQKSLRHSMAAAADPSHATAEPSTRADDAQPALKLPTPTEAFYSSLLPALKAAGIDSQAPRKEWPPGVVKQVVRDLMRNAPKRMISHEILAGAAGPGDWCARQQAHARAAAVMSMIGWLMGLGDRHLDNILLDNRTGELVHIDYNVVFERGRQLRVPEIVPFRLTPSMQAALGVTGVEGTFRLGAEATLAALRASESALSTVLLSVLDDSSVDLSSGHHMSVIHKEADLAVTLKLVSLRIGEAGPLLLPHFSTLAQALMAAGEVLQRWSPLFQKAAAALQAAEHACEQAVFHQAALTGAQARMEGTRERLAGAQAAEGQMRRDIGNLRSAVEQGLRECRGWAERHAYTVQKLRSSALQELSLPTEYWLSSASRAPLGLVSPVGNPASRAVVPLALGSAIRPPPDLLGLCAAVDEKGAALLTARDQAMLAATAALQEYAAALQQVLPPDYVASSHHARWDGCFVAAIGACDRSLGGVISPAAAEGAFQLAWEHAPLLSPAHDAVKGYRALHVAAETTLSSTAASQCEGEKLGQKASEGMETAEVARAVLLQALQQEFAASLSSASPAFAEFLQDRLSWIQDQSRQKTLEQLLQLLLGIAEVAKEATGGFLQPAASLGGDESLLHPLIARVTCAAQAQASFDLLLAPALVGCAAAGPNAAMLKDAAAINRLRQAVESILHEARHLAHQPREEAPSTSVTQEQGGREQELDANVQALAMEIEGLQQRAAACVDQLEAMFGLHQTPAAQSPILPAFGHLYRSLRGLFLDGDNSRRDEASLLSDLKGWQAAVFSVRLMDDLLRSCFEQPGPPLPTIGHAALPHTPSQESTHSEPHNVTAAQEQPPVLPRLQSTLATALGDLMLRSTSAVIACMHHSAAKPLPSGGLVIPTSSEGLNGSQLYAALLEADPLLESADQELDRLEQEGPTVDEEDAEGLDWLDEAAMQQQLPSEAGEVEAWGGAADEEHAESLRAEATEPFLQPFLDFDEEAGGAEGALESSMEQQGTPPGPGLGVESGQDRAMTPLELEPFMGFDGGFEGADEPLESDSQQMSGTDSNAGSASSSQQSLVALEADERSTDDEQAAVGVVAADMAPARLERQRSAAMQELTAEGAELLGLMKACVEACGAHATFQLQKSAVLAALQQAEGQPAANAAAIALYEWAHEPDLAAAGVLGPPIEVAPQGQQGWTLRHRRSQLLGALDAALRTLAGADEALAAWAAHAAAAEAALQAAVSPPGEAAMGAAAHLSHFLELRRQWLTIAGDQAASLMRLGQAVLQLELSREGKAWAGASGAMGGCEGYRPLMQQLQLLCTACVAAVSEAHTAHDELAALDAELAVTAPALEAAAHAEREASAAFASLAAPVLEHSAAAGNACEAALTALERAPLRRMDFIVHDLKHLAGQGVTAEDAVRDLAREALQHHRSITAARPALSAALLPLMQALRQPPVQPSAAGRVASLVAAARPHAATAEAQVAVALEAATAAERLQSVLPSVAEAATAAVQALQQPGAARVAHAGTQREHGGRGTARQAQAVAIYERFMDKLTGRGGQRSGQQGAAQGHRLHGAAGGDEGQGGDVSNRPLSVSEQVSVLIEEATSLDKLAQMYEGWSAWI